MSKKRRNDFDLQKIKLLKTAQKVTWAEFSANLKKQTGLDVTPRHIRYCIEYNDILTSDLSCIAQYFKLPITFFLKTDNTPVSQLFQHNFTKPGNKKKVISANN